MAISKVKMKTPLTVEIRNLKKKIRELGKKDYSEENQRKYNRLKSKIYKLMKEEEYSEVVAVNVGDLTEHQLLQRDFETLTNAHADLNKRMDMMRGDWSYRGERIRNLKEEVFELRHTLRHYRLHVDSLTRGGLSCISEPTREPSKENPHPNP